MTRIIVLVEGVTEETFVNEVLAGELYRFSYTSVGARMIGKARSRARRGGIIPWTTMRETIANLLKEDTGRFVTTMVDYYGLPQDWPGRAESSSQTLPKKAYTVESALSADIEKVMGTSFYPNRFVPYVMMHEFEAMLFSDCERFSRGIERPELAGSFQAIRDEFASPEEIDDSPNTAPSKRIQELAVDYQKPVDGFIAVQEIGLDVIRSECAHFREWLETLERLPGLAP